MFIAPPVLSLLSLLSVPVADRLPNFNTAQICEASIKAMGSSQAQTVQQCITDENGAKSEIEANWAQFSSSLRERCIAETQVGGGPSYVDVLECLRLGAREKPM
ncbi:hypothetical protein [Microvirga guangxiensis]|uniref:Uncharacterized protein n=1 Tax=Microvirga guangxiensis TaxID=549386 RepID=A0A1G5I4L5_9HYPH|nr:hypothetical protein [Microvirga guangxiensis]SCY71045.1 hypothetical protein SAMN02927923_02078 [Microvirga guangxiensis]